MNPLAIAALAGGAALVLHETNKNTEPPKAVSSAAASQGRAGVDPGMDSLVASAVSLAVQKETDPSALMNFADVLKQAGFQNSADAISAAANKVPTK